MHECWNVGSWFALHDTEAFDEGARAWLEPRVEASPALTLAAAEALFRAFGPERPAFVAFVRLAELHEQARSARGAA